MSVCCWDIAYEIACGRLPERRDCAPMSELWSDTASNGLYLWTSMTAGMMSPGLYGVFGRSVVFLLASSCWLFNVFIFSETGEPVFELAAM